MDADEMVREMEVGWGMELEIAKTKRKIKWKEKRKRTKGMREVKGRRDARIINGGDELD